MMRIYRVNIEHCRWGLNFSSEKVTAKTCEEAIRKVKKGLKTQERVESVELLESED